MEEFVEEFLRAARALASDPEAISIAEEFLPLENEALELVEHTSRREGPGSPEGVQA